MVTPDDTETGDGQCLGRVTFSQDERAVQGVPGAGVVSVVQLGDALQLGVLRIRTLLVHLLLRLEAHPRQHGLDHATLAGLGGESKYKYVLINNFVH